MKFTSMVLLLLCLVVSVAAAEDASKPTVRIGVKKRAKNCTAKARKGDTVHVHYTGTLQDGTEFDSSLKRGTPFTFTLGSGQVIKGWDQGLLGMCEQEKRRLVIPPELGYGKAGSSPVIPPNAVLVFEIEMVKIDRRTDL